MAALLSEYRKNRRAAEGGWSKNRKREEKVVGGDRKWVEQRKEWRSWVGT